MAGLFTRPAPSEVAKSQKPSSFRDYDLSSVLSIMVENNIVFPAASCKVHAHGYGEAEHQQGSTCAMQVKGCMCGLDIGFNVGSRLVWGFSIVRSFAEIIQHPLGSFGGP